MPAPQQTQAKPQPRPKPPIGISIAREKAALVYSYPIEKFRQEKGVCVTCLWAFSVFVLQWMPIEYWTKLIIQAPCFAMIFVTAVVYTKLHWGRGKVEVSFAKFALTHKCVPRKAGMGAPDDVSFPLQDIQAVKLAYQPAAGKRRRDGARGGTVLPTFTIVTRDGHSAVLFQSRFAEFIFRHLRRTAQRPEIQKVLPGLKFEAEEPPTLE